MRQGEILGIAADDIDLDGGWIHVTHQIKRVRSRLVYGLPKSDRDRRIPLPDSVGDVLRAHLKAYPPVPVTLPWENPASTDERTYRLVLTTSWDTAINRSWLDAKTWKPALAVAGIEPSRAAGMHALRHFYASALLDAGKSIKALASYLGHTDPGFTLRVYTHLMPASEERTRKAIDALFRPDGERSDGPATAQDPENGGDIHLDCCYRSCIGAAPCVEHGHQRPPARNKGCCTSGPVCRTPYQADVLDVRQNRVIPSEAANPVAPAACPSGAVQP